MGTHVGNHQKYYVERVRKKQVQYVYPAKYKSVGSKSLEYSQLIYNPVVLYCESKNIL